MTIQEYEQKAQQLRDLRRLQNAGKATQEELQLADRLSKELAAVR